MDINEIQKLINSGVGMVMATRDKDLFPDVCEVFGLVLSDDAKTATAFVSKDYAESSLQNISNNGCIAISFSRPCTFKAAQIKGRVLSIYPMSKEQTQMSKAWADGYRKEVQLIGVTHQAISALKMEADTALEIAIENIFIQTPGQQAGKKMETT